MRTPKPKKLHEWLTCLLLFASLFMMLFSSLLPLQFSVSWAEFKTNFLQEGKGGQITLLDFIPDFDTVAERLLIFVPIGFLIHQKFMQRRQQHALTLSVSLVVLIAIGIEISQAVISTRHSRLLDFILAASAGIVGIKLSTSILLSFSCSTINTARQMIPGLLWLGNYLVVCICIAAVLSANTEIGEWNCDYPLLIGNELTNNRPWQGNIRGLAIYPKELKKDEIKKLSNIPMTPENTSRRDAAGAIALYSFTTNPNHRITIDRHIGPALDLSKEKQNQPKNIASYNTIHINNPFLIKNTESTKTICQEIVTSKAFTIETEIASGNLAQGGPARIISNSIDLENRNFMLGEENGNLVFRVRTLQNGLNGEKTPFKTKDSILTNDWQHVIASYAGSIGKFVIDGEEVSTPLHHDDALFLNTAMSVKTALATGFLLLGMGILGGILHYQRPPFTAIIMSTFSTSLVPLIAILATAISHERLLNVIFVGAIVFIPLLGFILLRKLQRG